MESSWLNLCPKLVYKHYQNKWKYKKFGIKNKTLPIIECSSLQNVGLLAFTFIITARQKYSKRTDDDISFK